MKETAITIELPLYGNAVENAPLKNRETPTSYDTYARKR